VSGGRTSAPRPRFTGMRKALAILDRPGVLARKAVRVARRKRSTWTYRDGLARGAFVDVPAAQPADLLFTVVMPVHRVAERHLRAAIASVSAQTYPGWELVLVNDGSPDAHVSGVLAEAARSDRRIRVVTREASGGIAVATDDGVRHGHGPYVAFLDHDDLLHPRALEIVARRLAIDPALDWLFSDEDKVDENGRHSEPCFKPGWSRHLLLAFNYVAHMRVVRRSLLDRLEGHRPRLDGAQDYDLALRAAAAGARFGHVPGVLYHWRTVARSMARLASAKPAAHGNALMALIEHADGWERGGARVTAEVALASASLFRVRRAPDRTAAVAVLAPALQTLEAAIDAARGSDGDIVVVPPPAGFRPGQVDELLALLNVPDTVVASGRGIARGRVATSGWVGASDGRPRDPWAGLPAGDPGYLNLAMAPGPRSVPPECGWAAWREALLSAWDAAGDVPPRWRLAAAGEIVATPEVSFPFPSPPQPPSAPPPELAPRWSRWLDELGLAP
jgi:hypothetical protein